MAEIRINGLANTAQTASNDDYVVLDGATNGTRKMLASKLTEGIEQQLATTNQNVAQNAEEITDLKAEIIQTAGIVEEMKCELTDEVKTALLACFTHVAWIGDDGQTYYDALSDALNRSRVISSISAVFAQGSATIYDTDELYALKQYLTVTVTYSDGTTKEVNNYTLSGNLIAGTSTITVAYNKKTTTFDVTVTHQEKTLESISATFSSSASITTGNVLDDLRPYLTVRATYSDGSTNTITNYALSGSLNVGTNTITVTYNNKTATFSVTVSEEQVVLQSITAVFNQGSAVIYTDTPLNDLKQYLTVTGNYSDGTSQTITNYTLRGTLTEGTSTITASYSGKTDTFDVNVTAKPVVNAIRNWDFTKSLVDSVSSATAVTTATRNSNGLTFDNVDQCLDLGTVYSRNRTYEIDISYIGEPNTGHTGYRRIFAFGENGTNTASSTAALIVAMSAYRPGWYWYLGSGWDSGAIGEAVSTVDTYNYFDGKTMKIYIDSSGYGHVYAKTIGAADSTYIKVGVSHSSLNNYSTSNAHVYAGGSASDRLASARITGYRIYEGEK